jgi:hypothetical protein
MNFLCSWKYRKIKFFIKSKFIIGCINIVVHTCWCICVFVLFGFNQSSKWIQTVLETDLKRFWNKRKSKRKGKLTLLSFGPKAQLSHLSSSSLSACWPSPLLSIPCPVGLVFYPAAQRSAGSRASFLPRPSFGPSHRMDVAHSLLPLFLAGSLAPHLLLFKQEAHKSATPHSPSSYPS